MSFYIFYTWKTATRTQREARGDVRAGCLNRCHLLLTAPLCHCDHFHFHSAIRVRCLSWSFNVSKCAFLKVQIFTQMFSAYSSNTVYESFQISKKKMLIYGIQHEIFSLWHISKMTSVYQKLSAQQGALASLLLIWWFINHRCITYISADHGNIVVMSMHVRRWETRDSLLIILQNLTLLSIHATIMNTI